MPKQTKQEIEEEQALDEPENQNPMLGAGIRPEHLPKRPSFKPAELDLPEEEAQPVKVSRSQKVAQADSNDSKPLHETSRGREDRFRKLQNEKYAERNKLRAEFEKSEAAKKDLARIEKEIKATEQALKSAVTHRGVSNASRHLKELQAQKEFATKEIDYHSVPQEAHKIFESQQAQAQMDAKMRTEFNNKIAIVESHVAEATVMVSNFTQILETSRREVGELYRMKEQVAHTQKVKAEAIKDIKDKLKEYERVFPPDQEVADMLHKANKTFVDIITKEKSQMEAIAKFLGNDILQQFHAKRSGYIHPANNSFEGDLDRGDDARTLLTNYDKPGLLARLRKAGSKTPWESLGAQADLLTKALSEREKVATKNMASGESLLKSAEKSLASIYSKLARVHEKITGYFLGKAHSLDKNLHALEARSEKSHGQKRGLAQLEHEIKSAEFKAAMKEAASAIVGKMTSKSNAKGVHASPAESQRGSFPTNCVNSV